MLVSIVAAVSIKFKCPKCQLEPLMKIDRMVRCTCGWWMQTEEEEELPINSVEYATVVAS